MLQILRLLPGTIIGFPLAGHGQGAVLADIHGSTGDQAVPAIVTTFSLHEGTLKTHLRGHEGGAGNSEIADIGAIGSFAVIDAVNDFGDQAVDVEVALTVTMTTKVQRHVLEIGGEIGSVIEIESAQEILVGFARARMLGGNQTGNDLEKFHHSKNWAHLKIGTAHRALLAAAAIPICRSARSNMTISSVSIGSAGAGCCCAMAIAFGSSELAQHRSAVLESL